MAEQRGNGNTPTDDSDGLVLVVEDDPEINELVGAYVGIAGFQYVSALNGTDALREAHARHPAVILLDVMLPDIDGFEVCRRLRHEQDTAGVPVIILTALDREEMRRRGLDCGATEFMSKPFDPERLMAAIRRVAAGQGHAAAVDAGASRT
jgi:DNA-binding response OmpR family regulator